MKKFKISLTAVTCIMLVFVSCDDGLLDVSNPNAPTTDTFWQSEDDAIKGVTAVYQVLTYEGLYMRMGHALQDFRSDDTVGDSPWGDLHNIGWFNTPATSDLPAWMWRDCYQGVFRANQAIEYIPGIDMNENLKTRLIGEAKFLRGLYYFHLINNFLNVPLILEVAEGEEDYYVPQASPEDVWAQIISDFQDAKAVLPETYDTNNTGRATWGTATGYLGRSYLYNERWDDARVEFQEIIDSGLYDLVEDYRDNGDSSNENNEESLFEVQFSRDAGGTEIGWAGTPGPNWGRTHARSITYAPEGFGWADTQPSRHLYNTFLEEQTIDGDDDPRMHGTMFYNRPDMTVYGRPYEDQYGTGTDRIFWRKYQSDIPGGDENDQRSEINIRMMRYADVLLMHAEAQNELNNQNAAAQSIQIVRDRANLPDRELEFSLLSQEAMRDRIAHERFLELAGEQIRWHDIRRWGWLQDPDKLAELRANVNEFDGYAPGREWLPIPQGEIDTNPLLEQNPGY